MCYVCSFCNNHKSCNIAGRDFVTGDIVRLFNPRQDSWHEHFAWDGAELVGVTPIGRVTVDVLAINLWYRRVLRESLIAEGVFPPAEDKAIFDGAT